MMVTSCAFAPSRVVRAAERMEGLLYGGIDVREHGRRTGFEWRRAGWRREDPATPDVPCPRR